MVKNILRIALMLCFIAPAHAQKKEKVKGNRIVTIQDTPINAFNRIEVNDKFKIDLMEGSEANVFVETDDNLHNVIEFTVVDSTLTFTASHKISSSKKLNIKVSYTRALREIELRDNSEISSLTSINLPEVTLTTSGTSRAYLNIKTDKFRHIHSDKSKAKLNLQAGLASIELNETSKLEALINADSLQVDMYQRSDAEIEGDVAKLQVNAENSTTFTGKNLTAKNAEVIANLNADVYVQALETLTINATGNSEIFIYETPVITIHNFTDTAKLHKKELKK